MACFVAARHFPFAADRPLLSFRTSRADYAALLMPMSWYLCCRAETYMPSRFLQRRVCYYPSLFKFGSRKQQATGSFM